MSNRVVPEREPFTLWNVNGTRYMTKHAAYYSVAKAMVVAKYRIPIDVVLERLATFGTMLDAADGLGITVLQLNQRVDNAIRLFFGDEPRRGFDSALWSRFVHRLAKFLRFVDERRDAAAQPRTRAKSVPHCPGCNRKLTKSQYPIDPEVGTTERGDAGYGHYGSGFCSMKCGWRYAVAVVREVPDVEDLIVKRGKRPTPTKKPKPAELPAIGEVITEAA